MGGHRLLRDRDGRYRGPFDAILADTGITIALTGVQIPRMNSIMERQIQYCRHELPDRTLTWNQAHLLHAGAIMAGTTTRAGPIRGSRTLTTVNAQRSGRPVCGTIFVVELEHE